MLTQGDPCLCVCVSVCLSVCLSVCVYLSQPLISKILGRFRWNLDHITLTKIWDDTFLKFLKFWFDDVISAFFVRFWVRHSNVFDFCAIFFKLIHFVLQLIALYGIANQRFRFKSSIQNCRLNNGKTVKTKNCENRKAKRWFMLIWNRWLQIWQCLGRPLHNWPLK